MKKVVKFLFILLLIVILILLYGLKLSESGMSLKNIGFFIAIFFVVFIIAGGLIMVFTKGVRKKLNNELKKRVEYNEED